ncbi:salicylate synthase [Pseudonocardia spinosispora]|uniref:salicylate synthase n=1 Tax=Pseudonocardia spinosispora TaxID=103441 RepID=UPI0003F88D45|nr:salicylate synthase [Pseudonocardia spinosispora]
MSELMSGTTRTEPHYAGTTVNLGVDPVAAGVGLARGAEGPFVLYERHGEVSIGIGAAAELIMTGREIRLTTQDGERRVPVGSEPLRQIGDLLAECGIAGWRAYGYFAFELSYLLHGMPDAVGDATLAHLIVPAREVRLNGDSAELRALHTDDLAALCIEIEGLREVPATPVSELLADEMVGYDAYRNTVSAAVDDIHAQLLRKVILSRVVPVPGGADLAGTYQAGRRGNTPARSFLLNLGDLGAAGFSPETVVEVRGDGTVSTQPLAGTRALSGDTDTDTALREELLADPKEIYEHAVSVLGAQEELRAVCTDGSVLVEDFMSVSRRGSVQHLASRVTGRLAEDRTAWHALACLFPAVTASGVPKLEACQAIHRYESEPRHLYSGAVVVADADGSLDAALVLRTVFQRAGRTWLRAGAGVVGQSNPEREFEETREKLRSISRFLVPATEHVADDRRVVVP